MTGGNIFGFASAYCAVVKSPSEDAIFDQAGALHAAVGVDDLIVGTATPAQ